MHVEHPLITKASIEQREYQLNIAKTCMDKSTLVVLPTGMGKTVISLLVIAEKLQQEPGKILFLAPTKPLVEQHYTFLRNHLHLEDIALFTGEVAPHKRAALWLDNRLIVSTPQVIENDMISDRLKLTDVSLIIFDEAHRAVGNYAYAFIGERYEALVLGMTASPGYEVNTILEVCQNLKIGAVEIRSEHDRDVIQYVQPIRIRWVEVSMPNDMRRIIRLLDEILDANVEDLRKFGLVKPCGKVSTKGLLEARARIQQRLRAKRTKSLYYAATSQASAMKVNHALELGGTQGATALRRYFERLAMDNSKAARQLMRDERMQLAIRLAQNLRAEHPKLGKVIEIVKEQLMAKPDSRIIVFTHYRDTSELVVERLSAIDGIKPMRFIGQASREGDKGLKQKEQAELIQKFRDGVHNVMVCTSVGEEGLDIPSTDLVVFYEPVPSEIRTIQRRGRTGRKRPGKVVILITKGSRDEAYYWSSLNKERTMRSELHRLRAALQRKMREQAQTAEPEPDVAAEDAGRAPSHNSDAAARTSNMSDIPSQVRLDDFDTKLKIIVDQREFSSPIVKELVRQDVAIKTEQLDIGDYILSDRLCVERKEVNDFLQSLIDGRLFSQLKLLRKSYQRPILVVEGEHLFTLRNINQSAIFGALATVLADFGIPIINTKDPKETAALLKAMTKREFEDRRLIGIRGEKRPMALAERQQFIVEGLPNVSATIAQRLLGHFGSIKALATASPKAIMEVKGIGKKRAMEIANVLRAEYLKQ